MNTEQKIDDTIIRCSLRKEYVEAIRSGAKTYEGRVNTNSFKDYLPGQTVQWYFGSEDRDKVLTKIISRTCFPTFESMLSNIGFKKFLPRAKSMRDAVNLYHSISGYQKKVVRNGALALEICVIPTASVASAISSARPLA